MAGEVLEIVRVTERAVLVCQTCPYVWEPAAITGEDFAALIRSGCPDCGGWVWLGELVGAGEPV